MSKFNKPTPSKLNTIWATNAITGDVTEIDTSKIQQGWVQEKPPYESENWINQQHDQYIAYINQLGIPEWDQYTEYQAGKSYVQGSNDIIYKCIQTHVNKNPATAGNEAFWNVWEGNRQATTTLRGTVGLSTNSQTQSGTSSTVAVTPSSLQSRSATETRTGLVEIASETESQNFLESLRVLTPQRLNTSLKGANQNLSTTGHQILPGGLIMQWGVTQNQLSQTFDIPFPNAVFVVMVTDDGSAEPVGTQNKTTTGFDLIYNASPITLSYLAIGY